MLHHGMRTSNLVNAFYFYRLVRLAVKVQHPTAVFSWFRLLQLLPLALLSMMRIKLVINAYRTTEHKRPIQCLALRSAVFTLYCVI